MPHDPFEKLADHLLVEIFVRLSLSDWPTIACVKKRWASLFRSDGLWQMALTKRWPSAARAQKWPGPIGCGSSKRRYAALHVSENIITLRDSGQAVDEVAGHVYLFLKEKLEANSSSPYSLLHAMIVGKIFRLLNYLSGMAWLSRRCQSLALYRHMVRSGPNFFLFGVSDQFLMCGKANDAAHSLASQIWVAVIDNLDETEKNFHLLMRIAEEWEVFLPYPYSKSQAVQWRLFERLFTDFRDCLTRYGYYEVLARAKRKFELIPPTWLGY